MSSPSSRISEGGGYPRTCGHCGTPFVAVRGHAWWCSDRCRLRAWRQRNSSERQQKERQGEAGLVRQVRTLQAALEQAQDNDGCAHNGCRLEAAAAAGEARGRGEVDAAVAPWRNSEWEHPLVQRLRAQISEQAGELDRLREENGLLRHWVSQHVDHGQSGMAGA